MAPLAALCRLSGRRVTGSDCLMNSKMEHLKTLGVTLYSEHFSDALADDTECLIYSSAVPPENPERRKAFELGIPQLCRGAALAEFSCDYKRVIAVSGAHGKSSITALISHILKENNFNPGYMIGADFNGSLNYSSGNGDIFVTEADESDGTHKLLQPWCGVIPNYDPDHAWSVGGEEQLVKNFQTFADRSKNLLYYGYSDVEKFCSARPGRLDVVSEDFTYAGFFGYEAANAQLAVECCKLLGCSEEAAIKSASTFPGIARRMSVRFNSGNITVIEDYAHHPTEVHNSINLLRHRYKDHHLRVIFQPHRYARLEMFFDGFVSELKRADSLFVAPVFAAWSEHGKVDSNILAEKSGGCVISSDWQVAAKVVLTDIPSDKPLLIAVLGAGDINGIFPGLEQQIKGL